MQESNEQMCERIIKGARVIECAVENVVPLSLIKPESVQQILANMSLRDVEIATRTRARQSYCAASIADVDLPVRSAATTAAMIRRAHDWQVQDAWWAPY